MKSGTLLCDSSVEPKCMPGIQVRTLFTPNATDFMLTAPPYLQRLYTDNGVLIVGQLPTVTAPMTINVEVFATKIKMDGLHFH